MPQTTQQQRTHKMRISPFDSMVWFIGVIEDLDDPTMATRARVRAIHFHTEDKSSLPTEDLPWAPFPHTDTRMSGVNAVPGDWVVGFFVDGKEAQQPMILAFYDGVPTSKDKSIGFNDPSGVHPKVLNKPTNSPLARNDLSNTNPITYSKGSVVKGIKKADDSTWDEPASPYAAKYPSNHVIHTDADNVIELDDSKGAERIHIFHHSGSLVEIHPDGSIVHRSLGSDYRIVVKDNNVAIGGDCNISVYGDANILSGGKTTISSKDNIKLITGQDFEIDVGGDFKLKVAGDMFLGSKGDTTLSAGGSLKAGSEGMMSMKSSAIFAADGSSSETTLVGEGAASPVSPPDSPDQPVDASKVEVKPYSNTSS